MNTAIQAERVDAIRRRLGRMPGLARRIGTTLYETNGVVALHCGEGNDEYDVQVNDGAKGPHEVSLWYENESGAEPAWEFGCSCPLNDDCGHGYAALLALRDHFARATGPIRQAESGAKVLGGGGRMAGVVPDAVVSTGPIGRSMVGALAQATAQTLSRAQRRYAERVDEAFARWQRERRLTGDTIESLGFRYPGQRWDPISIWPKPPADAVEFWHHLAYAVTHLWHGRTPEFMGAVTALETADAALVAWRRKQEVNRWQKMLVQRSKEEERDEPEGDSVVDLRVRLMADRALVERRDAADGPFLEFKTQAARELAYYGDYDPVEMTAAGRLIWSVISDRVAEGQTVSMAYDEPDRVADLAALLCLSSLEGSVVTEAGQPYRLAAERLRWDLQEPLDPGGDYLLRLVCGDGSPVPAPILVAPGRSLALVTADTIYLGPPLAPELGDVGAECRIPAVALETAAGAHFLRRLKVELPRRLQARVRVLPVRLRITCELVTSGYTGTSEYCRVGASAWTDDGAVQLRWTGSNWAPDREVERRPGRKKASGGEIVTHDRSVLARGEALFAGLKLRWQPWLQYGEVRVTRTFPEEFNAWRAALPPDTELELRGDLASLAADAMAGSVRLNVAEAGIDWFDLTVVLDVADVGLTPEETKLLLNARGGYVRLKGKGWRRLKFDLTPEEDDRLARLGLNPHELTGEAQRLHVLQLADPAAQRFLPVEQFERVQRRASELQARVTPDLPAGIQAELRPYQRDGFHFLCYLSTNRFGGILADDMGLGKTLQTLAWLLWLRSPAGPASKREGTILVVCPKSVMDNWRREIERFAPSLRARVWSPGELDNLPAEVSSADLHVINYNQLRLIGEALVPVSWQAVILDEGQYIKNPSSQTAQVARSLRADHRLVLSGTPIENRLMDLWSLMTFAMPGALGSRAHFGKMFGGADDPLARRRLSARVRPFLIRRTKSQVARDLPDRIEEDLLCEMEGEQKSLYRAEMKVAQQILLKIQTNKDLAKERFHFLTSLLRLRQICCDPRLVKADAKASSAKVEALIEQLEPLMEEGQKVLIFSQFVSMLDLLRKDLAERKWPLFFLAGETENRGPLVDQFQAAAGPAVFLISLKAGGFGLNLTAAGYVVLFDPWWNPAVENQAIDRTHRIGQKQNVIAYRLLIKDSIEEKIRALQKQKKLLAEDVLGEEKFAQSLTLDDLRFLLAD